MESRFDKDNWSLQMPWNELVTEERKSEKREYIRASEIGSPFLDRYLKMKGVTPTNHFDSRTLRVFDCGHIFEDIPTRIFRTLGLLISNQKEVAVEIDGLLPIIGHHDPKVGGVIDIPEIKRKTSEETFQILKGHLINSGLSYMVEAVHETFFADWYVKRCLSLAEKLKKEYPNGLKPLQTEIKTVHSQAFWAHKNIDSTTGFFKGYDHHNLQLFTYLVAENEPEGRFLYISKDDLTIMEKSLFLNDKKVEALWIEDIRKMTKCFKSNKEPEREPDYYYNKEDGIYQKNWRIARSPYFTYITGKSDVKEWSKEIDLILKEKNKDRCKNCESYYMKSTLNKNNGYCAKCYKLISGKAGENIWEKIGKK